MKKIAITIFMVIFLLASQAQSGTYWVSSTGTASWSSCSGAAPLSGTVACSLSTANKNAVAGDTVYLRAGTYTITDYGINPTNNGTSDNMITFSGYESETVTITGATGITGRSSKGINLSSDSYIKVTKLTFSNLRWAFTIEGGGHNEISHSTFTFRDPWADVMFSGTAKNDASHFYQSAYTLYDPDHNFSTACNGGSCLNFRIFNTTAGAKGTMLSPDTVTTTTNAGDTINATRETSKLLGGVRNTWENGDTYVVTPHIPYSPAPCNIGSNSTHNYIHHNTMHGMGGFLESQDGAPLFQVGNDGGSKYLNNNNTIDDNHIYHSGHHTFGVNEGLYNVVRHNYIHNEAWFNDSVNGSGNCAAKGNCGYRVVSNTVGNPAYGGHGLWENNRIAHGDQYGGTHLVTGGSGGGTTLDTPSNIYRYNEHFNNAMYGVRFGASLGNTASYNKVYNNTFYHLGYRKGTDAYTEDSYRTGILFYASGITGVSIKNNLFYDMWSYTNKVDPYRYYPAIVAEHSGDTTNNTISNNYMDASSNYAGSRSQIPEMSNPLFIDSSIPDPDTDYATAIAYTTAWPNTSPDLRLQSSSPAVDQATYLTQANGAGSSTTLVVVDASYFQDGTYGSDLAMAAGVMHADWIAIGTVDNVVEIESIDYSTNTITLATPTTWADDAPIWLYKKSDGTQVLYGYAPDMGAHEYGIAEVTTEYAPKNKSTLAVTSANGSVTSSDGAINCGSTCSADYDPETSVTLTATANSGYTFTGWLGEGCTGTGTCTVSMIEAKSVTANFAKIVYNLIVTKSGTGAGTVTGSDGLINCGYTCSVNYESGKAVTLTALAKSGSVFSGWTGGCSGIGTCTATMTAAKSVTATFTLVYNLTVTKSVTGAGTITSSDSAINCGSTCSANYYAVTSVTLTAAANTGYTFTGWSGGGCSGTGTCTVSMTMTAAKSSVTANFAKTVCNLTVTKNKASAGTVTGSDGLINCGYTCSVNYESGKSVTLTAVPSRGYRIYGWANPECSGTGTCTMTMTGAKKASVLFIKR